MNPTTEAVSECNPEDCKLEGDCQSYRQCVDNGNGGGSWVNRACSADGDLFWNPEKNSIHGGVCDFYGNLSPSVQQKYKEDVTCIPPCAFYQDVSCSPNYNYREEFNNKTTAGRESSLSCPQSPNDDDIPLYFSQATLSCDKCSNVNDSNGAPCGCPE